MLLDGSTAEKQSHGWVWSWVTAVSDVDGCKLSQILVGNVGYRILSDFMVFSGKAST